ncbi:hypothetical protein IF655_14055 [Streptomyces sp. DSM 110735]|uniref:hypothetical protein n=1 Tax=Streptomyces sp. DSM 110735 TaxID=2775031 RepID=UPI0018F6E38A|nr:hypothetical protein [Streptomyces sp. DSM 110735]MBJ7904424.1 hypothetical protein [Streptomyces sp. DSM 110735]
MSRETDTPSSGSNGRGGAAYPSGTPPYGTPAAADGGTDAGRSGARSEERKTETTLTTRIRINIPGSRPIPPVVVRKTVGDGEGAGDEPAVEARPEAAAPETPAPEPAPEPAAPQPEEKTSDWFAPRKSGPKGGAPGGGGTNGAGMPGGAAAGGAGGATGSAPALPAGGQGGGLPTRPSGGASGTPPLPTRPGGATPPLPTRPGAGAGRPGGTNGAGLPGATGGPVAPGHGGGTGSFDVTEALSSGPLGGGPRPGGPGAPGASSGGPGGPGVPPGPGASGASGGEPTRDDLPYFSDGPARGGATGGASGRGPGGTGGFNGPGGPGAPGPKGPAGPTGGPVTGDAPLGSRPGAPGSRGLEPGEPFDGPPAFRAPGASGGAPFAPAGALGEDTAVLTPQPQAALGHRPPGVSGPTVSSGAPATVGTPFAPGVRPDGPAAPKPPAPAAQSKGKPKKKGRSKLVLLVAAVVVVAGGAYGAGLLMNRSDVPSGTTVLGVDIGGGTRDDAVKKLDDAFGRSVVKPLRLEVGGKTVSLTPDKAGLQFDYQATVSDAAKSDYNPVSVIGSLFGQKRVVDPVMPVDEEKLQAALENTGGGSGSVVEGGIKFEAGKAVPVYGKAGRAIDAARSTDAVRQAYRTLVETGDAIPVTVPTTEKQPTVSKAEVDREMKEFAKPAMSGLVTVRTDAAHQVVFSPQNSLWKFLRVKAVSGGKLVDAPDQAALKELYGKTFDDVLITRATGQKTPVTVQDVYGALRQALLSTSNRTAVIDTNPN